MTVDEKFEQWYNSQEEDCPYFICREAFMAGYSCRPHAEIDKEIEDLQKAIAVVYKKVGL